MNLKILLLIILIVSVVAAAVISIVFIYNKKSERSRCYRAAANIIKEKYLRTSLMNPRLQDCDIAKIYDVRTMAYIKNVSSKPKKGYIFDVSDRIVFGREENCNVILNEAIISGEHCVIYMKDNKIYITDKSTNGTILKRGLRYIEMRGSTYELFSNDMIILGSTCFRLTFFQFDGRWV